MGTWYICRYVPCNIFFKVALNHNSALLALLRIWLKSTKWTMFLILPISPQEIHSPCVLCTRYSSSKCVTTIKLQLNTLCINCGYLKTLSNLLVTSLFIPQDVFMIKTRHVENNNLANGWVVYKQANLYYCYCIPKAKYLAWFPLIWMWILSSKFS